MGRTNLWLEPSTFLRQVLYFANLYPGALTASFDPTNDVKQNVVQVILTLQLTIYLGFCNLYE